MIKEMKGLVRLLLTHSFSPKNHFPEEKLLNPRRKGLNNKQRDEFDKDYQELIKKGIIIRVWKRTGHSSDWHIGLNPKLRGDAEKLIKD